MQLIVKFSEMPTFLGDLSPRGDAYQDWMKFDEHLRSINGEKRRVQKSRDELHGHERHLKRETIRLHQQIGRAAGNGRRTKAIVGGILGGAKAQFERLVSGVTALVL